MPIEVRWLVDPSVSAFHAAEAAARGIPLADAELADALAAPLGELQSLLAAGKLPHRRFWDHLVPQSAGIQSHRELASVVLTKTIGRHQTELQLSIAAALSQIESAARAVRSDLVESVSGNASSLRRGWEEQGSVLLETVGRLTEEGLLVASADVLLCDPACGGAGAAHLLYNSVRIEVPPPDLSPEFPEVVRLVWLLSQLNMDVPVLSETIRGDRLPMVAALAMLPAALIAAEQMSLAAFGQEDLTRAIAVWCPGRASAETVAEILWRWWHTYLKTRPAWSVGIGALDQMLSDADATL